MGRWLPGISLIAAAAYPQGRLRPPPNVGCDRNDLTSYQGKVREYARDRTQVSLVIDTDEGTVERVVLKLEAGRTPESRFLWDGEPFQPGNWKDLESSEGKLNPGVTVIAWVCTKGGPPLLDWRPPPR